MNDLHANLKTIVDANRYMTIATANEEGRPWVSPVWFATEDYRELFWVSRPGARHSRNIAVRPGWRSRSSTRSSLPALEKAPTSGEGPS